MHQCGDVIVVCDGCTDNTLGILHTLPSLPDIVNLKRNCGKGAALKHGFRRALERGFAYAITLDGDGQHFPEDIPLLLQANIKNPGALIVGKRKGLETMQRSCGSKFANAFSNFWFAVQTGHCLEDTQTGYRLYPLKKLRGLGLLTSRYEAELELLVFASWHGVKLVSIEVDVFYPPLEERVSHFRSGLDFARISLLNGALCCLALVYGLPLTLVRLLGTVLRSVYALSFFSIFTMLLLTPFIWLFLSIGPLTERKKERLHEIICKASRFILFTHGFPGSRYTQTTNASENFSSPAIIICNHQSHLDLLPMLALTPKLVLLTNNWVWNSPFYGYIIHRAEFLPVSDGIDSVMPQLKDLVSRGYSIAVYPEGSRSLDCNIGRFHQGAFHLAEGLGLDILPTILYGAGKVLPKHGRYLRKWPMHFEVDARFSPQRQKEMGLDCKERTLAFKKYYLQRYREICNKIEQDV